MALPTRIAAACLLTSTLTFGAWAGAADERSEYQIKSAFLVNFARFVEWPAAAIADRTSFVLCVVGRDPFGPYLDQAAAHNTIKGWPLVILRTSRLAEIRF